MEIKRLEGAVEAILFAMGESVELGQIAKAIQQDKPTTEKLLHNLMDKYKDEGRGSGLPCSLRNLPLQMLCWKRCLL